MLLKLNTRRRLKGAMEQGQLQNQCFAQSLHFSQCKQASQECCTKGCLTLTFFCLLSSSFLSAKCKQFSIKNPERDVGTANLY